MTAMVITLVFVSFMLAVLVSAIRRLGGAGEDSGVPFGRRSNALDSAASARSYQPLGRLFSAEDSAFLRRFGGSNRGLSWRLSLDRSRVLRLYLRQIHADFDGVWRLAREITPHSRNPDFGLWAARQWIIFHLVLILVYVRSWFGWSVPVPIHVVGLVKSLEAFRVGVRAVVQGFDPITRRAVLSKG